MNNTSYIFLLFWATLFFSCQKEIGLENPNKQTVLVVNGYVSPDQGAIIDVSHSILDITQDSIISIKDAKASLFEDDVYLGDLIYTPIGDPNSVTKAFYINPDLNIQVGKEYNIEVEHAEYDNVTAKTSIPELSIDQPALEYIGKVDEYKSKLKLRLTENSSGTNYYAFTVWSKTKQNEIVDGDTIFRYDFGSNVGLVEFDETGLSDLASTGLEIHQSYSDFAISAIDNSFFINGKMDLTFDIHTTQTTLSENEFLSNEVWVEVRQMSEEYFNYVRTLAIQEKIADDPFAAEVIVSNNIEGGLGNFAGFQSILSDVVEF